MTLRRKQNIKLAVVCTILLLIVLMTVLAPWLAPYLSLIHISEPTRP